jgi:hypothetical protein
LTIVFCISPVLVSVMLVTTPTLAEKMDKQKKARVKLIRAF